MQRWESAENRRGVLVLLVALLALGGCSNPFQVGLGNKVDLDVPDVALTSHQPGAYLSGTITLNGVYTDDFEVSAVTLSFNGGATSSQARLNPTDNTWSFPLNTASLPDGETEVIVTVIDGTGKAIEKRQLYYFDNTPPLVVATVPGSVTTAPEAIDAPPYSNVDFVGAYNGGVVIKGEAGDRFGIASLEYQIRDASGTPQTGWTRADGTNSWSFSFDSIPLANPTGTLQVAVRAIDRAGNTSTGLTHSDAVEANNGGAQISVESLVSIANGGTVQGATITPQLIDAIQVQHVDVTIDQAADKPVFVVSNPDQYSPIDENVLSSAPRFTGSVEDDNEGIDVDSLSYEIRDLSTDAVVASGSLDSTTDVNGTDGDLFVRWSFQETGLVDGDYYLTMTADDANGTTGSIGKAGDSYTPEFRVDSGAPTVVVTSPSPGSYENGSFVVRVDADDEQGVTAVRVTPDGSSTVSASLVSGSVTNGVWEAAIDPAALGIPDGPRTINVEATDGNSTGNYNVQVVIDRVAPTATFINPAASSSVNGEVVIRGTASDDNQVTQVELKIGDSDPFTVLPGLYNWEYTIDSTSYASTTHATETSPNVWRLDVQARVTDVAGNQYTETGYFFYIDNDLDKPTVTFVSPSDGQRIAGPTLVSGTAFDDDAVDTVSMQLDLNNDGDYVDIVDLNGDGPSVADLYEDESTIYTLSGTTLWSLELNNGGELYGADGGTGLVTIKVWAEDIYATEGNAVERTVQFDDTIPRAENLNYASSDFVRGTFTLNADITDDVQVKSVQVSFNGGQSYETLVSNNTVQSGHSADITKNGVDSFTLHMDVDTQSILPGLSAPIDSDILYLRLKIDDEANYQSITYINLNVDNLAPAGTYTADPLEIDGSSSIVQGTATDSGAVSGIDAIHVYFVRSGQVYRLDLNDTTNAAVPMDFDDGSGSIASFDYAPTASHRLEIDSPTEAGVTDSPPNGDSDGVLESLTVSGGTYNWWAELDSTLIPDGPIELHYVVFDSAGNGTHYQEAAFIKNNRPVLQSVELGTDLNNDGDTTDTGERTSPPVSAASLPATGFTAVNNRLYVGLNATGGNGTIDYSLVESTSPGVELVGAGNDYALVDTSTYLDGTRTFELTLTDAVGIEASATLTIEIANSDATPPTITFNALWQSSVKGFGGTLEGHLEESGNSLHHGSDPDVSGTMVLEGTAWDDQRLQTITVRIDGFDAGSGPGAPHVVAVWDEETIIDPETGVFELADGETNFTIVDQTLTEDGGHNVTWTYEWDSSAVAGVVANDTAITFDAADFGSNSAPDASRTVDVVPYITAVERDPAVYNTNRSKFGAYPIQSGETGVVIRGFNLDDSGSVVLHTNPTGGDLVTAGTSDPLGISAVGAGYTSLTASLAGVTHSGWLRLTVDNGTEAIEATNLVNDNSLPQNQESTGSAASALWTDDRYVSVWEVGDSFADSGNSEYPSMSMDSGGTLWGAWTDYATSEAYFGTTAAGSRTSIFYMYDPAEYTDIHVDSADNITVAYLGNYYGGSGWDADIGTAGSINVWNADAPQQVRRGWGYPWNDFYRFEMLYHDQTLLQFQRPKVVRDSINIHLAYFDNDTKSAKYGYVQNAAGDTSEQPWVNLDGGSDADDTNDGAGLVTAGIARTGSAGEYLAIDVDEAGNPVVMYYDTNNATLRLARALNNTPQTPADWVRQDVFRADDPNRFFVGKHVSMIVDSNGGIHAVAAKTSVGDLVYVHAADVDGTSTDYTFDYSVIVDSEGAVGSWADIALDESGATAVPFVSYINNSMAGTYDGIKLAYFDPVSGLWEHQIVPAATAVGDNRTSVEHRPAGGTINGADRRVAVGYKSSTFDIVYRLPEE